MPLNRAPEKLSRAVYALATKDSTLRERLTEACKEVASIGPIPASESSDELPVETIGELRDLIERITRIPGIEGAIAATVQTMDAEEMNEVATSIVRLYEEVAARQAARGRYGLGFKG